MAPGSIRLSLLTRSDLGPAGGCASQEEHMQNESGGQAARETSRSRPGWIGSRRREPSIPETGSRRPAPTRRLQLSSSPAVAAMWLCASVPGWQSLHRSWLNATQRTRPCRVTSGLSSTPSCSVAQTCARCTHRHTPTPTPAVCVPGSGVPDAQLLGPQEGRAWGWDGL